MATITTGGSVLDINTLVDSLMAVERRPRDQIVAKAATETTKLSAFGQIKSVLSSLQTAADALKNVNTFTATKATVSGEGFTASSHPGMATAEHSIEVLSLAQGQRVTTSASGITPSAGSFTVQFGKMEDGTFAAEAGRTATLDFTGSTLAELRDAINADSSLGLKATVINNGTADQLVLSSASTGADTAFQISGSVFSPDDPEAVQDFAVLQTAQDARVKIDGVEIARSRNTISDAIDGLTLTLTKGPEEGETSLKGQVRINNDTSAAKAAIERFVEAYNEANSTIRSLTAFDVASSTTSTLTGDSTVRNIQQQLRGLVGSHFANLGGAGSLAEIGITSAGVSVNADGGVAFDNSRAGDLTIDSARLEAALNDPSRNVTGLFTSENGFATRLGASLESILDSRTGAIATRTDSLNNTIKSMEERYAALDAKLITVEERYRLQFSKLDSLLAGLQQTSTYLSQQLANLPQIGN